VSRIKESTPHTEVEVLGWFVSLTIPDGGTEGAARYPQTNPSLFGEVVKNARLVRPYSMSMASPVRQPQLIYTKGVTSSDKQGEGIKPRVPPGVSAVSFTEIEKPWEPAPGTPLVDKVVPVEKLELPPFSFEFDMEGRNGRVDMGIREAVGVAVG